MVAVMPESKPRRPIARPGLIATSGETRLDDVPTQLDAMAAAIANVQSRVKDRVVIVVDLAVGANRLNHGLGRAPTGATVTPTAADATWAWALTSKSATQLVITTVGVAQTGATIEVF